ncbi:MAG: 23S rRNA (adenine(2503)-C(2))-methyltransferase RlmN [Oligoflexus sp.]
MTKAHILSLSHQDIADQLSSWGQPRFRAPQIMDWIYHKFVTDLDKMSNLPKALRNLMQEHLDWQMPQIINKLDAADGSSKLLLRNQRGFLMETVILRYENRTSLCVSSQVGCKLACSFCQTGKLGFVSHLTKADILSQLLLANQILAAEDKKVSHVVFMGMGEPLDNYKETVPAANQMIDPEYFGLSARHVTISSSGLAPQIEQLADDSRAALAISLHASRDDLRTELMPINRKYSLQRLKQALLHYQQKTGRKITIEYILIRQTNCGLREAKELVKFLHGLRCKVNLIPFNAHPGLPYDRPEEEEIRNFQKYLSDRSIPAPVRYSKGLDVSAACGQLAAKNAADLHALPQRQNLVAHR